MQPLNHRPGPAPSLPVEAFHFHQYNSSPGLLWTLWPLAARLCWVKSISKSNHEFSERQIVAGLRHGAPPHPPPIACPKWHPAGIHPPPPSEITVSFAVPHPT